MKQLRKSKLAVILIVFSILILINVIVFGNKYISNKNEPLISQNNPIDFIVNKGDSLYKVFDNLYNGGELKSPFFSKVYLKLNNVEGNIIPGNYQVNSDISLAQLIEVLEKGLVMSTKVTIPEGYSIEDIGEKLEEGGIVSKDEFIKGINNYKLPEYVKKDSKKRYNLEGYLFPDTYNFPINITVEEIIDTMIKRFEQVMAQVEEESGITIPKDEYEKYVTMAAMIEKEARVDDDRPLVSSVIYNRLDKGMPLQLDATILYSLGQHKELVTYKDLEVDSPYNTYRNKGLPVGPIASPGKESLLAAVKPAETDYIFYLLAENNKHYFTNNYDDFLKKKKELGY